MDLVLLKPGLDELEGASLIDGTVIDTGEDLTGCIELVSMHFGMKQQMTTDVSNAARTSGRPSLNDITATKYLDKTSPLLYKHCLSAAPLMMARIRRRYFYVGTLILMEAALSGQS